ncbi:hypothetical protein [Chryseobacterium paludis]|uniref:hypothetical protein n=1 Tax=Chryseobacterium paludis TaxID=2956784 RepID=UPI0021C18B25|nr:hypothetical protein [Chryseobacterium paludis]
MSAKNPGVDYNTKDPIQRSPISKYFVRGWWTDNNDAPITEALFGDTVKFHLQTQNIPDGQDVTLTLFDDDTIINTSEDKKDDQIVLVHASNGQPVIKDGVNANKIVKTITLNNFESLLKEDTDGTIELYFKCKYESEEVKFPSSPSSYLKVKGKSKIIFVNGHWNRIAYKLGMSPGAGGEQYWVFFTGDVKKYKNSADAYFNIKSDEPLFIDGSSLWGGSESGGQRKTRGYDYAKAHFDELKKGLGKEKVFLISHSEGGAHAAGICQYLTEQGIKVGESLMLSTDEGDEFSVEGNYPAYQIVAGYLDEQWLTKKKMFAIDPVVMDNRVKGVNKYGVFISRGSFTSVHGITIEDSVFNRVTKLKNTFVTPAWNSKGESISITNPLDEDWYRIDDDILQNKKIDLYPLYGSTEPFRERQD